MCEKCGDPNCSGQSPKQLLTEARDALNECLELWEKADRDEDSDGDGIQFLTNLKMAVARISFLGGYFEEEPPAIWLGMQAGQLMQVMAEALQQMVSDMARNN